MARMPRKPRKPRAPRLYTRRWARLCDDCGKALVFLDNPGPRLEGHHYQEWIPVELYGERDGVPMRWNGEIAYDERFHVRHLDCPGARMRLAGKLRRIHDDI